MKCKYRCSNDIKKGKKIKLEKKGSAAEFTYTVCYNDYQTLVSNYDKIYDRINIALTLCGAVLIILLNNIKFDPLKIWSTFSMLEKISVGIYFTLILASATLMVVAVIKLLLLSRGNTLLSFNSNCITNDNLFEKSAKDAAELVTRQYIVVINDTYDKVNQKQKSFNTSIVFMVISVLAYAASVIILNLGLK